MSVANTYAFCQDVLFVWSKGSEGEMLPGNSAIKTNAVHVDPKLAWIFFLFFPFHDFLPQPDSGGQRHFMMVVAFHDLGQISQWDLNGSGVTIYYDTGSNFVPASKLMVCGIEQQACVTLSASSAHWFENFQNSHLIAHT